MSWAASSSAGVSAFAFGERKGGARLSGALVLLGAD